jgi:flagellar biosynthesis/type III secretory pathway M-ring protein FliF/YscJ
MYGLTNSGVAWLVFVVLVFYVVIPVAFIFLFAWILAWIFSAAKKNKKMQLEEQSRGEQDRCLGCGAVIDSKQQSCQICGWTWK